MKQSHNYGIRIFLEIMHNYQLYIYILFQAYAHSQYEAAGSSTCDLPQYQEVRQHFPPHYSMEGGSHADLYQAAHSTYERISPVEDYHEEAESSGVSSYSTLQPVQPEGNPLIAAPVVDSSTLHHAVS